MAFNVGDVVTVLLQDSIHHGEAARIERVLPKRHSVQDFQEYIVEFPSGVTERFRFCLYREFELVLQNERAFNREIEPRRSVRQIVF